MCVLELTPVLPLKSAGPSVKRKLGQPFFPPSYTQSTGSSHPSHAVFGKIKVAPSGELRWFLHGVVQSGSYSLSILDLTQSYHCIGLTTKEKENEEKDLLLDKATVGVNMKTSRMFQNMCKWLLRNKIELVLAHL